MSTFYSHEAKQRVANAGTAAVAEFIESISAGARQKILSSLPKIPGFRTGSQAELKERYKRLLSTLTHTSDPRFKYDGKEWMAFANLWARWAEQHFENAIHLDSKLPAEYDEEATYKFFETLIEKCGEPGCPKEDALKLYQLSGFPTNLRVEALISNLPVRKIVEQRRKYASLPTEVENLRDRLARIETEFQSLGKQLSDFANNFSSQLKSPRFENVELETLEREIKLFKSDLKLTSTQLEKQVNAVSTDVETVRRTIALHDTQLVSLSSDKKKLLEEQATTVKHISQIERANKDFMAAIDKQLEKIKLFEPTRANSAQGPLHLPHGVRIEHAATNILRAKTVNTALSQITNNLTAVGVHPNDAETVAVIVLVAVLSGQLLQISGSLADVCAAGICCAVGGNDYIEWEVPLGLCNSEQMSTVLAFSQNEKRPNCLLIKGINKSAFEIYGNCLRQLVISSQIGLHDEAQIWPVIATIADGPTTLPSGVEIVGLGPVLDTDKLVWYRAKPEKQKLGTLSNTEILSEIKQNIDADELSDLAKEIQSMAFTSNQMRKQLLQKTTSILLGVVHGDAKKAFENTVAYWVLPWAKVNGETRSDTLTRIRKYSPGSQEIPMIAKALAELQEEVN